MRFGFLGLRGLNEFQNEFGEGFYFKLERDGVNYDSFFPNVGQPNQTPPQHTAHRDNPKVCSHLRLGDCSFAPFRASYRLLDGNYFHWRMQDGIYHLTALVADQLVIPEQAVAAEEHGWKKLGDQFWIYGAEFNKVLDGEVELWVSSEPRPVPAAVRIENLGDLPQPENPAIAAVFYNLTASKLLEQRLYVPVNKVWCGFMSEVLGADSPEGPLIFAWDGAFASIILAEFDLELAQRNFLSLLEGITPQGRIPQIRIGNRISNRSGPPIWFLALETLCEKGVSRAFLEEVYPKLLKNYHWFKRNRINGNYTFSWGSDDENDPNLLRLSGKLGAVIESGLDDSPLFDEMQFAGRSLDYACIDLSCLMYRACEILLRLAEVVDIQDAELRQLKDDQSRFGGVLPQFFSTRDRAAQSFGGANGHRAFASALTPASFYPLLCGSLSKQQSTILKDLYCSTHFCCDYGLPSLSMSDQRFSPDGDYWRGRIWPPLVYLAAQGFRRYHPDVYEDIKKRARRLLLSEWDRHGHIHENYSALSGEGEPQPGTYARSRPLYSWGGLLGVI